MTKAVLATFSDARPIKTRSVLQLVFEVPIDRADEAMKYLGGFPQPAEERWVGIALAPKEREKIEAPAEHKDRKPFHTLPLSQQAALRCDDGRFLEFIEKGYPAVWKNADTIAEAVRLICVVESRAEFDRDNDAAARWKRLDAEFFAHLTDQQFAESVR